MSRPSLTAVRLARSVALVDAHPDLSALLPPGHGERTRELLRASGLWPAFLGPLYRSRAYRAALETASRWLTPGILAHLAARKRFMEEEARAALAAGAAQVLVLGGGLDPGALLLAEAHPSVPIVEVDLPGTAAVKARALVALGATRANLRVVGEDLSRRSLRSVLDSLPEWRPERRSLILAEGLLMYLPRLAVVVLLDQVFDRTGPGSRLVFSYLGADARGRPDLGHRGSGLVRAAMRAAGSPLRWGASEDELRRVLGEGGFALCPDADRFDLQARYLTPAQVGRPSRVPFERVAVAERRAARPEGRPRREATA
ncbi:MAG: class I SAM-dependent methyltransferase [Sandaracinaceae bacterium]